jgi:SNF2 family DNA or RNA helicase
MAKNPPVEVVGYKNMNEFETKLKSIMFRVKSEDVLDLPETQDLVRTFTLNSKAQRLYDGMEKDFVALVEQGVVTAANALVKLLRLQQLTSGYLKLDDDVKTGTIGGITIIHTDKAALLKDCLEDLPYPEPMVVFARFRHDLAAIKEVFEQRNEECLELSGKVNELKEWQDGRGRAIAVQIQAGGEGVDLTRARYCAYFSLDFSLGRYLQSRKRNHRPGQKRTCFYIHFLAKGTIDEQVYKALDKRQDVINAILEEVKR